MAIPALGHIDVTKHYDPDLDASAQVVGSGAETIYAVLINNLNNTHDVYVRFWNDASPTVGTDDPYMILWCRASEKIEYEFTPAGIAFGTACTVACVQEAGTSGATSPTNDVPVTIWGN